MSRAMHERRGKMRSHGYFDSNRFNRAECFSRVPYAQSHRYNANKFCEISKKALWKFHISLLRNSNNTHLNSFSFATKSTFYVCECCLVLRKKIDKKPSHKNKVRTGAIEYIEMWMKRSIDTDFNSCTNNETESFIVYIYI